MGLIFISNRSVYSQSLTAKGCVYTLTLFLSSFVLWVITIWNSNKNKNNLLLFAFFLWPWEWQITGRLKYYGFYFF